LEADLIKGAMNLWSVGTLVERTNLIVVLAKMPDGLAQSALAGFSEALSAIRRHYTKPSPTLRSINEQARSTDRTRGRGGIFLRSTQPLAARTQREHQRLVASVFAEELSPVDLFTGQLDAIAWRLNTRPRKSLEFKSPAEVYSELFLNIELAKHNCCGWFLNSPCFNNFCCIARFC